MQSRYYYLVNGITLYRLVMAPVLILLVIYHKPEIYKWLLAISFFTDIIDGYFARKLKVASMFGARMDSIADDFTIIAAMTGILVFKRDFLQSEILWILALFGLFILQIVIALIRYGRISSFHTYGAKIAFLMQGIFIILLFFLPAPWYPFFYITCIVTALELVEEIMITLVMKEWKTNVKGLYWVLKG